MSEDYRVKRARGGGYVIYVGYHLLGVTWTLWGAKRLIQSDKRGVGPGSIAYREKA